MSKNIFYELDERELLEIDGGFDPATAFVIVACAYFGIWNGAMKNALKPPTL